MASNLTSQEDSRPIVRFNDLPQDVLYTIVSKLPPKEFARTSILSSKWRCMWPVCPRLTFDAVAAFKWDGNYLHYNTWKFISEVNDVLFKHHGNKVVETLEVRIRFVHNVLAQHIDTWVRFAVSSRTKNLTLDLLPFDPSTYSIYDMYVFPLKLFDAGSISRLQHMQLSFISLNLPLQFRGFPNLRKLHLKKVYADKKDLEHVISHCCNLEWLRINCCALNYELTVDGPLSRLLYLSVEYCKFTKIQFHAVNLATFEYDGRFIPIDLSHSLKLQSANIDLGLENYQPTLTSLLNGISSVRSLTLMSGWSYLENQWLLDNPLKLYNLRHLQLFMSVFPEDVYSLVSFLRVTPFIEKLEVHFGGHSSWLAEVGPSRKDLGQCKYKYLKNIYITKFIAARGQLGFILHVVENAPALEVVTVQIAYHKSSVFWPFKASGPPLEEAKQIARTCLSAVLPHNVKFDVV